MTAAQARHAASAVEDARRRRVRRWWRRHTQRMARWSTAKLVLVFSMIGLLSGPAIGYGLGDVIDPPLEPYLQPLRGYLGITPPAVIPYITVDRFPDPTSNPTAVTSSTEQAPPASTAGRPAPRQTVHTARPRIIPMVMDEPATTTTRTVAPPVSTLTTATKGISRESTTTPHPKKAPRDQLNTTPAAPSSTAGQRGTSTPSSVRVTVTTAPTDPATTTNPTSGATSTIRLSDAATSKTSGTQR